LKHFDFAVWAANFTDSILWRTQAEVKTQIVFARDSLRLRRTSAELLDSWARMVTRRADRSAVALCADEFE